MVGTGGLSVFSLTLAADLPHGLRVELEEGRELVCEGDVSFAKTKFEKYPALSIAGFDTAYWTPHNDVEVRKTFDG
jgi:hypothetical protein